MKTLLSLIIAVIAAAAFLVPVCSDAGDKEASKISDSIEILEKTMAIPEKGIPPALLKNAQGIAIIPGVIKAGFIIGGRYGTGIVAVRTDDGDWSSPSFVSITGGSIGWQIGAESTDFILVFKTRRGVENIAKGKFTLGADAAVAAGPVGRQAEAATDVQLKAEIYSYSRSRGLFAGISLEGASLQIDDEANVAFYGKEAVRASDILEGRGIGAPPPADRLKRVLLKHTR